jgi:hypothetical protein
MLSLGIVETAGRGYDVHREQTIFSVQKSRKSFSTYADQNQPVE